LRFLWSINIAPLTGWNQTSTSGGLANVCVLSWMVDLEKRGVLAHSEV